MTRQRGDIWRGSGSFKGYTKYALLSRGMSMDYGIWEMFGFVSVGFVGYWRKTLEGFSLFQWFTQS